MLGDLVLIHRTGTDPLATIGGITSPSEVVVWETCLRQILLGHASAFSRVELQDDDEMLSDRRAYQFLLEVVCGLHSKIQGENEIVGQFKKRFHASPLPELFKSRFSRLLQSLLSDMKQVRTQFPLNSGVHSYGSFVRKAALGAMPVTILGTGELAASILPWVLKENDRVRVLFRSEAGRDRLLAGIRESAEKIDFTSLGERLIPFTGTLVIAAPIEAKEVLRKFSESGSVPAQIIDFRRECESDPILVADKSVQMITLHDFFRNAKDSGTAGATVRTQALDLISTLSSARYDGDAIQIRTGGWEDLCG